MTNSCTTPIHQQADQLPLYRAYPSLAITVPRIPLCTLPTPVQKAPQASQALGIDLWIKRDDLTDPEFGGNKKRKLEFLYADALGKNARAVIVQGSAGSNFVVAAAHAAQHVGLICYAALKPQHNAHGVRKNLRLLHHYGAKIHMYDSLDARTQGIIYLVLEHKRAYGDSPYIIPAGGSYPIGVVSYVNAAFELKEQILQGLMPEPDYIYVSSGSMGTAAGLILGARAAGLKSIIVPVCVEPEDATTYADNVCTLLAQTNDLLCAADPTFPRYTFTAADIPVIFDCSTEDYGLFSPEGMAAKKFLHETEGITLDGTYTANGFRGVMQDARSGKLQGKTVLFWHTYCAHAVIQDDNYKELPIDAHTFLSKKCNLGSRLIN